MKSTPGTAEGRYSSLRNERSIYLTRAREAAKLTLPMLIPEENHSKGSKVKTPYQGVGARGVNNLASKLLLALLPPNTPFFRLNVDDLALKEEDAEELKTKIETALGKVERAAMTDIESSGDRAVIFEGLKHLIVSGNALLQVTSEGSRVFPLSRFVVSRDPMGNALEIVVFEQVAPAALDEDFLAKLQRYEDYKQRSRDEKALNIFTHVKRKHDKWVVHQEVMGEVVPGTKATYPIDACPYIPLRFLRIDGEDYGRGYVEEYLGDLKSLEALTKAIVEGAAAAAKLLILVDPNGTTRVKTIAEAPNGAVREGNSDDVSVLQMNKFGDFRTAENVSRGIEERLSFAFLLNTAIQRNGERVTAEEIRYMAGELEDALGGVYSILSQEFQLPYVNRRMHMLTRAGKLPDLPKDIVKPTIVTGIEALGRGHDRNKLVAFIGTIAQMGGPEAIQRYVHLNELMARLATADGIDTEGLIKTVEEMAAEQQQAEQQNMMSQFGPEALKQMGGATQEMLKQGNQKDG